MEALKIIEKNLKNHKYMYMYSKQPSQSHDYTLKTLAGSCGGKAKTLQHISKGIYFQYEILIYR